MPRPVRLCLALHNHQPIGNFHHVFEQAYEDSYQPFLDVFEDYGDLRISLHISGPLMEWLDQQRPRYLDRLADLAQVGRLEILGGAFYEPILPMIPQRDRQAQIESFTRWIESRFGCRVQGMWTPERVWEQSLTYDLARAGIRYTILDDFHFQGAGIDVQELHGYYVTEDQGEVLALFPGSERLRYLIPFQDPWQTVDYLRQMGERFPNPVFVFGDDGEKFGTWPNTKNHCYRDGWLRRFFDALVEHRDWIKTCTLAEAHAESIPTGKVYIPDSSYREMTEWALPVERQAELQELLHSAEQLGVKDRLLKFLRGGYWRNFKVRYPETNEMYSRMMAVSQRLAQAEQAGWPAAKLQAARQELHRGQCNCSYWHGAFGGVYLPHLRQAVYHHLITADNLLDQLEFGNRPFVKATAADLDLDGFPEVRLENEQLICLVAPVRGGQLYELDVRAIGHNLGASLTRQPEAYHARVRAGARPSEAGCASIHDQVIFKQEDLDQKLQYDRYPRKSLIDHFLPLDTSLAQIAEGTFIECGDFAQASFDARLLKNPGRIQLRMQRRGLLREHAVQMTKGITLNEKSRVLELAYLLEGLPGDCEFRFAVEFQFAGLPAGNPDRYFFSSDQAHLGDLGSRLELNDREMLGVTDEWLGLSLKLHCSRATQFWTFPLYSVSQSEGGFELVHQSVALFPHWVIRPDSEGRWSVTLKLEVDTSLAEQRGMTQGECAGSSLELGESPTIRDNDRLEVGFGC